MPRRNAKSQNDSPSTDLLELESAVSTSVDERLGMPSPQNSDQQEFYLPVTKFASFFEEEVQLINHPALQRLGTINQLGLAHLVYRGATHKRLEHVLGATAVASRICDAINRNMSKRALRHPNQETTALLSESEIRLIRLAALLHDVGHVAAGHTLEDELYLLDKHDEDDRISYVYERESWYGETETPIRGIIDENFNKFVPKELRNRGLTASTIARLIVRKPPNGKDNFRQQQETLQKSNEVRFSVCQNIVANTICADLLDYLYRDWHHIGRSRTVEDRLFHYMEISRSSKGGSPASRAHWSDEFVIQLTSDRGRIRTDGVTQILGLLEWRYELAETVLFHRTKVAAVSMLGRALFELWGESREALVDRLIELSDEQLVAEATREADQKSNTESGEAALLLLTKLRKRRLYSELHIVETRHLKGRKRTILAERFGGNGDEAANKFSVARAIERDAGLPAGSITIACVDVKPKIADVNIEVDGEIAKFSEYETKQLQAGGEDSLSGGHLVAQIDRFAKLWRLHFFIDSDVLAKLSARRRSTLVRFLKEVITSTSNPNDLVDRSRDIARNMVEDRIADGDNSVRFVDNRELEIAGRYTPGDRPTAFYPNGAPYLSTFIQVH